MGGFDGNTAAESLKMELLQQSIRRSLDDIEVERLRDGESYLCELIDAEGN